MAKAAIVHSQQRWEYLCVVKRTETSLEKELNELGQSGWELVSVDHGKDLKGIVCWTGFVKRPAAHHPGTTSTPQQVAAASPQSSVEAKEAKKEEPPESPEGFDLSGEEFGLKEE